MQPQTYTLRQAFLVPRLLIGAMTFGLVTFAVVANLPGLGMRPADSIDPSTLTWVAVALTVVTTACLGLVRPTGPVEANRTSVQQFLVRFMSRKVVALALIEGPGLFWVIIAFWHDDRVFLGGAAFAIILLLRELPSEAELENASGLEFTELVRALES